MFVCVSGCLSASPLWKIERKCGEGIEGGYVCMSVCLSGGKRENTDS